MENIIAQISYPVLKAGVFEFIMAISILFFLMGVGLAIRNPAVLRFYGYVSRGISVRRLTQPLFKPHFVEPVLHRHLKLLGSAIIIGAVISLYILANIDAVVFQPVFHGAFTPESAEILAGYTKYFLLVGNGVCVAVGLLALFFPRLLSKIESYTDKWYTLRKQTLHLNRMHSEIDNWVLAHPTTSGLTLSLFSLLTGISSYAIAYA